MQFDQNKLELDEKGYSITAKLYSDEELKDICRLIDENTSFSEPQLVYSIRKLLQEIPELKLVLFNDALNALKKTIGGNDFFLTKAIYFDKPEGSNWFVSYHQDLSISVAEKHEVDNFQNWTVKKCQFGVQPPTPILENTITVRIHLDDSDENNGALKVVPNSHKNGIVRLDKTALNTEQEVTCSVSEGSAMLMKPLTFHSSKRSSNGKRRRVIHLEFCNQALPEPLIWAER